MTKLVLRRPISALLVVLAVAVFGIYSMFGLRMELMPEMDMPMLIVMTVYPGAAPNSVEKLVTKGVEDAGSALSGIDSVASYSYENYSLVLFTYDYGVDINECYSDLSIALDGVTFPDEAQEPIIMELSLNAMPTIEVSIEAPNAENLLSYVEDNIVPDIEALNEVAKVDLYGGEENYVRVMLNEELMSQYGLSISSVAGFITAADFNVPAGSVQAGSQDIGVVASSEITSLEDLRSVPLITATGSQITLGDVAGISMNAKSTDSLSRYNGDESIILTATKNQSAGSVSVARKVVNIIEEFQAKNPDMRFQLIYNAGEYIVNALSTIGETLLIGVACCMLVLLLFTGDLKASLIVGASMPFSVLMALCCMRLLGYTLNLLTAGSL
ncbi:MAG TPA: efflux RND transporter permease subunit, partial [Oscillospiraceae bacterium]|nr:efflux RND transporter permease subunit [Oscillospiraceae bacterium]